MQNKQAFTLIELLVVVLIIGILASVAMPQYESAVRKSRVMKYAALAKALQQEVEVCNLANSSPCTWADIGFELKDRNGNLVTADGSGDLDTHFKYILNGADGTGATPGFELWISMDYAKPYMIEWRITGHGRLQVRAHKDYPHGIQMAQSIWGPADEFTGGGTWYWWNFHGPVI